MEVGEGGGEKVFFEEVKKSFASAAVRFFLVSCCCKSLRKEARKEGRTGINPFSSRELSCL